MRIQEIDVGQAEQPEKRRRLKKKKRKKHPVIKRVVVFILFVATVVLLSISPIFEIKAVEVQGSKKYSDKSLIGSTDILLGENGFKTIARSPKNIIFLRYSEAEKRILKNHPYIKTAEVKFVLPGKMLISVTEREAAAIVTNQGYSLLMDREGYILDNTPGTLAKSLPYIKGLSFEKFELGQALKLESQEPINAFNTLLDTLKDSDKNDKVKVANVIKYIDVGNLAKISMNLDSRITVNIGSLKDLEYKIKILRHIYLNNIKKEDKGYLDLSLDKPVFKPEL